MPPRIHGHLRKRLRVNNASSSPWIPGLSDGISWDRCLRMLCFNPWSTVNSSSHLAKILVPRCSASFNTVSNVINNLNILCASVNLRARLIFKVFSKQRTILVKTTDNCSPVEPLDLGWISSGNLRESRHWSYWCIALNRQSEPFAQGHMCGQLALLASWRTQDSSIYN